LETKNTLSVT